VLNKKVPPQATPSEAGQPVPQTKTPIVQDTINRNGTPSTSTRVISRAVDEVKREQLTADHDGVTDVDADEPR
jgi:hypothetical protein